MSCVQLFIDNICAVLGTLVLWGVFSYLLINVCAVVGTPVLWAVFSSLLIVLW